MKKIVALTMACSMLAGCHYLGEPEAYTVVDEETAVIEQQPVQPVQPVIAPIAVQPSCGCGCVNGLSRPAPTLLGVQPSCGCGCVNGVRMGACQINPGVSGPLVIRIPEQSVCIK